MKYIQYRGPFTEGDILIVSPPTDGYSEDTTFIYKHIGFQYPYKQPTVDNSSVGLTAKIQKDYSYDFSVNDEEFRVGQTGFLEFDNLNLSTCKITIGKNLGASAMIDIGYEPNED